MRPPRVDVLIFLVAFAVRGVYLIEMRDTPLFAVLMGDGLSYDRWAQGIAGGDWYGREVFYQAPLYPYFLALIYALLGHDVWVARLVQVVIGSLSCVLLAMAGRRFFSSAAGAVAGFILALYGPMVFFDGLIQKPVLDVFFTCLLLLLLGQMHRSPRGWLMLAAGAVLGLFALTRENALVLAPIVLAWALLQFRAAAMVRRGLWAGAVLLGLALVLAPVGLRNWQVGGEFLITTSQMGPNFYMGNHAGADGRYTTLRPGRADPKYERIDATELAEAALGRRLTPGEVSRYWRDRALAYIRENPGNWTQLMLTKWALTWNVHEIIDFESVEAYREWSVVLGVLTVLLHFGVIAPVAAAGIWLTRGRWRELWLLYAILLGVATSIATFYVFARYRTPMIPVLILFAAAGVVHFIGAGPLNAAMSRPRREALICLLLAGIAINWPMPGTWDPRAITYQNVGISMMEIGEAARQDLDYERAGRAYAQAENLFSRVLKLVPPRSEPAAAAHKRLGATLRIQGHRDLALEHYRQALTIEPRLPDVQNDLAQLLAQQGRLEEAIEHWSIAAQLSPRDADIRLNLARAMQTTGRLGPAAALYRSVLALRPDMIELHLDLADIALAVGGIDDAIEHCRQAMAQREDYVQAMEVLAWALALHPDADKRQAQEAVELAQRAVQLTGNRSAVSLKVLAAAHAAAGQFDQAITVAEAALLLPDDRRTPGLRQSIEQDLRRYRAGEALAPWAVPSPAEQGHGGQQP